MIRDIGAQDFEQEVLAERTRPVLVKTYGPNCGPCHALKPHLLQLDNLLGGQLKILALDTARNQQIAQQYQVRTVPTLLLFQHGQLIARHDGSPGHLQGLQAFVQPHMQAPARAVQAGYIAEG